LIEILRVFGRSKSREALQVQRFPAFVFQGTRGILLGLKSTGKKQSIHGAFLRSLSKKS